MQEPRGKKYTYADYATWNDGKRYELIDGVVYGMSPAPSSTHQRVSMNLSGLFFRYLQNKRCEAFAAPFDVRLNADTEDDTVVQPDLTVVCDPKKIDERGCRGAPDLIIEILSPSTARHDRLTKFNAYLEAGVREYWLVSPHEHTVQVHVLESGKYTSRVYGDADVVPVSVLEDCGIDLSQVFPPAPAEEVRGPELPEG